MSFGEAWHYLEQIIEAGHRIAFGAECYLSLYPRNIQELGAFRVYNGTLEGTTHERILLARKPVFLGYHLQVELRNLFERSSIN